MVVCIRSVAVMVFVSSHIGDFTAAWVGPPDPTPGDCLDVEVSLGRSRLIWGVDVGPSEPGAEPGIRQQGGVYRLTGVAKGSVEDGGLAVSVASDCLVGLSVGGELPEQLSGMMIVAQSTECVLYPTNV